MADIKDTETTEKIPQPKCVIFDEQNNVTMAEESRTILVFLMGEDGVKVALNGYVTETLLNTLKANMPNIMDNLIEDFKKQAEAKLKEEDSKNENK